MYFREYAIETYQLKRPCTSVGRGALQVVTTVSGSSPLMVSFNLCALDRGAVDVSDKLATAAKRGHTKAVCGEGDHSRSPFGFIAVFKL